MLLCEGLLLLRYHYQSQPRTPQQKQRRGRAHYSWGGAVAVGEARQPSCGSNLAKTIPLLSSSCEEVSLLIPFLPTYAGKSLVFEHQLQLTEDVSTEVGEPRETLDVRGGKGTGFTAKLKLISPNNSPLENEGSLAQLEL